MRGLLIDIEPKTPDCPGYDEMRNGVINAARPYNTSFSSISVALDYIHFSKLADQLKHLIEYDFFILSPQGCPWSSYHGNDLLLLNLLATVVREHIWNRNLPTLGICGGHQFLAMIFGGEAGYIDSRHRFNVSSQYPRDCTAERGLTILRTLKADPIFEGITVHPGQFRVIQNHVEEVKIVPPSFINLAASELCRIQLIRLPGKVVYGMAFHPERGWDSEASMESSNQSDGKIILTNFLNMAYAARSSTHLD
ncbi:MAG: type 1 glutamine amidotransferase [Desulfomonilaceae bacterium]